MKPPITGTLEECMRHFSGRFLAERGHRAWLLRNDIAQLLGVGRRAGESWFTKFKLPSGENLVRLKLFLEFAGYKASDYHELESAMNDFARVVGLQIISVTEAANQLGINPQQVLAYILHGQDTSSERKETIRALVETHRAEVAKRTLVMKSKMAGLGFLAGQVEQEAASPESTRKSAGDRNHRTEEADLALPEVILLAQLVNAAAPLAERIASNEFSARDRQILRRLTQAGQSNLVFDLSNSLNRCCSEKARTLLGS